MRRALLCLTLILPSCGSAQKAPAPKPKDAFNSSWLPSAKGEGNLLVCLNQDVTPDELTEVTMPSRILFQSWGRQLGPLRDKDSFDPDALKTGPEANELSSYAAMTIEPFTISYKQPCVKVAARAVTNDSFNWKHNLIPDDIHYIFQVEDLAITRDFKIDAQTKLPDESPVKQILLSGALFATPIAPIGVSLKLGKTY